MKIPVAFSISTPHLNTRVGVKHAQGPIGSNPLMRETDEGIAADEKTADGFFA
jgi:hypothetical protein